MRKNKLLIALLAVGAMIGLGSCTFGQKESFTITFDTNEGSKIESITVLEDGTIAAPTNPTKEGYVFKGWYLDAEFNTPVHFESYIVEGNVTLYAKWEANTYTVTFNTNGGTGTADPVTVNHGEKITLPTGLTKDGCKLKAWYKDAALTIPFVPSAPVTSDLTLYAKWESLLTFSGTNSGNATYNAEDGTYTFTTTLGLYGRFSVAYNGALLSSDPEGDLIITGAFTSENQAGWDENLYCDVPDGAEAGSPIDYTTFICSSSRSVNYTVTYDPAANSLDIQAEFVPDEYEIPEEGLFYLVRDNNRLLSSYDEVEVNEDGSYSFTIELNRWWRVYLYFDGVEIDVTGQAADIKGDFGTWSGRDNPKSLYSDVENDGPNAFISSYDGAVEHKITYVPATDTAKAYVIIDADPETDPYDPSQEGVVKTTFNVDNAQDTALAVWTTAGTVFRDSAAGSWGPVANGWRTICIVDADGKIVYFVVNIGNGFGSIGEDGAAFYAHPDYATNNPAYKATDAGWTLTLPEGCIAITGHSDKALSVIKALTNTDFASSDDAQVVVNNMNAIVDTARVIYDATAGTIEVVGGGAGEQPAPDQPKELTPAQLNADAGGDAFALWTEAGHTFHTPSGWNNNGWRLFVVVDAKGRIAYMVLNAPNGYGGPSGDGYYTNGYYADYTKNPAIQILEGYGPWVKDDPNKASEQFNIVIPEGGFGISAHGSAIQTLLVSFANDANAGYGDTDINKRGILSDNLRLQVVDGKLVISEASEEEEPVLIVDGTHPQSVESVDGVYTFEGEYKIWNRFSLKLGDKQLTTSNTTFAGLFVNEAAAPWNSLFYTEDGSTFLYSGSIARTYVITYNANTNTVMIKDKAEVPAEGTLNVGGTFPQELEANNGVYSFIAQFKTWNRFSLELADVQLTTWNVKFEGLFVNQANAPWDNRFYTEDGITFLYSGTNPTLYKITYTLATKTISIEEYLPEGSVTPTFTGVNQGGKTYEFSEDKKTVTSTHGTSMNQWGRWDFAKPAESYTNAIAVIKGTGMALSVKLDTTSPANNKYDGVSGNKLYKTLDGYTVYKWDLKALGMDATLLEKLVFWAYDPNGSTTGTFELVALVFYNVEEVEKTPTNVNVTYTGIKQGGSTYVFSEDKMTVTSTHGTSMGQWGRWDYTSTEAYNKVIVKVKATSQFALCMKLDTNSPANNKYDGVTGNKIYKTLKADEVVTFEWDLDALGMDSTLLQKIVFWAYDPNGSTTGTFQVVSIEYIAYK